MTHNYSYDGLYRLTSATGTFEGSGSGTAQKTAGYSLNMAYDNLYNIISKKEDISQSNVQFSGTLNAGYSLTYNYANNPFQISDLGDANYRKDGTIATQDTLQQNHKYLYDANGNLIYVNTSTDTKSGVTNKTNERKLMWDEENRLMGVDDNGFVSLYWYDASGERVVKESGYNEGIYVNSTFSGGITDNGNNFTAYVNPYMVVTAGGNYTKHIYIGSQRIVSKLGDLSSYGADPRRIAYAGSECNVTKDYATMYNNSLTQIKNRYNIFGVPYNGIDNNDYVNGQGFCCSDSVVKAPALRAMQPNDNPEKLQFYYHSDHLGSTSLITDLDGNVAQHVEYIPFGEVFVEERNATWNTPYKFNAKELDEETGLYYYGARYYDPRVSVWLGVDPMGEKYPGVSVYVFTFQNPIRFIDINGFEPKLINGVYFIELARAGLTVSPCLRTNNSTFTASAQNNDKVETTDYTINGQMFEGGYFHALSSPDDPSTHVAQGKTIFWGKEIIGRSSPNTFYMALKNGKASYGSGDAPANSDFAIGGGAPIIINGLKYGTENIYSSDAPDGLKKTGSVSDENLKYLLQKSNSTYSQQNDATNGKSIIAYNSKKNQFMLIVQKNGEKGMTLDQIRDYIVGLGYDNAISFDGSSSATLVIDKNVIVNPNFYKNNTMPSGTTFHEKK